MDRDRVELAVRAGIAAAIRWELTEQPRILWVDRNEYRIPLYSDSLLWGHLTLTDPERLEMDETIRLEKFADGKGAMWLGYGEKSGVLLIKDIPDEEG